MKSSVALHYGPLLPGNPNSIQQRLIRPQDRPPVMTGINSLPDELLSEIFLLIMNMIKAHPSDHWAPTRARAVLQQVSRRWQQVCVSTAHMWTGIVLTVPEWHISERPTQSELDPEWRVNQKRSMNVTLNEQLSRILRNSSTATIDIKVGGSDPLGHSTPAPGALRFRVELLHPHMGRCRSLKLFLRRSSFDILVKACVQRMSLLEELAVHMAPALGPHECLFPLRFDSARLVTLSSSKVILDSRGVPGIVGQLRTLRLDEANILVSHMVQIQGDGRPESAFRVQELRNMERLEALHFGTSMLFAEDSSDEMVNLAQLKTLSINVHFDGPRNYETHSRRLLHILRHVRMPCLLNLHLITQFGRRVIEPCDDLLEAIKHNIGTVTSLELEKMEFNSSSLLDLLEAAPDLEMLHLSRCTTRGQFLQRLGAGSPVLVPRLRTLCLADLWLFEPTTDTESRLDINALESLLASRAFASGGGECRRLTEVRLTPRIEGGAKGRLVDDESLQRLRPHVGKVTVLPARGRTSSLAYDLDFETAAYNYVAPTYI